MLIQFSVSNFRSFGDEQTLSLRASKAKSGHPDHCAESPNRNEPVLRLSLILGPNGAGKSNLIRAMKFAQALVIKDSKRLQALKFSQFKFTPTQKKDSKFEFIFIAGGRIHRYGFTVTPGKVADEWLYTTGNNNRTFSVFERKASEIEFGDFRKLDLSDDQSEKAIKAVRDIGVRNNQLVLNKIVDLEIDRRGRLLNDVVEWLKNSLEIIQPSEVLGGRNIIDLIYSDSSFKQRASELLKEAGTGIDAVKIDSSKLDIEQLPNSLVRTLQSEDESVSVGVKFSPSMNLQIDPENHSKVIQKNLISNHVVNRSEYDIPFFEESEGTNKLLDYFPALIKTDNSTHVYVVDEFDISLHPHLTRLLIQYFIKANPSGNTQLIVTTHDTHLLDQELIRRDEVWFAEKDNSQQTTLFSLTEMGARKDLKIEKSYLEGRFRGIPYENLDNVIDLLLEK